MLVLKAETTEGNSLKLVIKSPHEMKLTFRDPTTNLASDCAFWLPIKNGLGKPSEGKAYQKLEIGESVLCIGISILIRH